MKDSDTGLKEKAPVQKAPSYAELYFTMAKVGVMTFGGGYAMIPLLIRELCENKKWLTEKEIMDYFAVGQCTPGVIAVNTATFTGRKLRGNFGGIIATLGMVLPSIIIITVIAALLRNFAENTYVQDALAGIRVCVCVLMFNAVVKLWKSAIVDIWALMMYIAVFVFSAFLSVSPIICVLICLVCGLILKGILKKPDDNPRKEVSS